MKNLAQSLFIPFNGKWNGFNILVAFQVIFAVGLWIVFPTTDFPSIPEILKAWDILAREQGLLMELWSSSKTIITSLILSSVISLGIVYIATANAFKSTAKMISAMRFLGFAGLTYLFTLWTSGATELKIALLTFGMTVFQVTNMLSASELSQADIDYVKTMKFKGWRITWEQVVLGKLHLMLDIIRQNVAIAWTMLSMVEGLVRSQGGIGALLSNQNRTFNLAAIFAIQLTILIYGLFQDYILKLIHDYACPYAVLARSK